MYSEFWTITLSQRSAFAISPHKPTPLSQCYTSLKSERTALCITMSHVIRSYLCWSTGTWNFSPSEQQKLLSTNHFSLFLFPSFWKYFPPTRSCGEVITAVLLSNCCLLSLNSALQPHSRIKLMDEYLVEYDLFKDILTLAAKCNGPNPIWAKSVQCLTKFRTHYTNLFSLMLCLNQQNP